jgi:hypothetical protein
MRRFEPARSPDVQKLYSASAKTLLADLAVNRNAPCSPKGGAPARRMRAASSKDKATMNTLLSCAAGLALAALAGHAAADARTDYYQRASDRDQRAFQMLDINHDGYVEQYEAAGDNDFGARFGDMDRNGDAVVTKAELATYIRDHYGIDLPAAAQASMVTQHVESAASKSSG